MRVKGHFTLQPVTSEAQTVPSVGVSRDEPRAKIHQNPEP